MAYQNVATPRFYINAFEFGRAMWEANEDVLSEEFSEAQLWAEDNDANSILNTLPTQIYSADELGDNRPLINFPPYAYMYDHPNDSPDVLFQDPFIPVRGYYNNNFVAFLAHNMYYNEIDFDIPRSLGYSIVNAEPSPPQYFWGSLDPKDITGGTNGGLGGQGELGFFTIPYSGFSIIGWNHVIPTMWNLSVSAFGDEIGSVISGSYYDMPSFPNLSVSMNRDYGKIKEITTQNGSSVSNTMGDKAATWGDGGAWELYSEPQNQTLSRSGRRTWDLEFSYIDDSDFWGSNQLGNGYREDFSDGLDKDDIGRNIDKYRFNVITDDNFFSQVWNKTFGGTIPFIFQVDKDNSNPDQFAICKFKDNSLKATQTAFNVYDVSFSIEEVW
tara:strand:+ start:2032 stop:3186 length:1155 start_codon:yes stop_codon:yes gene_type:complete